MIVTTTEEILKHYETMRQEAVSRWNEGWFCHDLHSHERYKFLSFPSIDALEKFRDYHIGGIGLEVSDYLIDIATLNSLKTFDKLPAPQNQLAARVRGNIAKYHNGEYLKLTEEAPELAKLWKFSANDPTDFGGVRLLLEVDGEKIPVSHFSVRTASRTTNAIKLLKAHQALKPDMSILELGGGFGRSLQMIAQPISAKTLYYVDLPVNLAIAAHYFQRSGDKPVNLVWKEEDACEHSSVNFVAPWLLEKLPGKIDLMLNFLSLHHMPPETHDFYYQNLIKGRVQYLYHENRLVPRFANEGEGSLQISDIRKEARILSSEELIYGRVHDSEGNFVKFVHLRKELLKY